MSTMISRKKPPKGAFCICYTTAMKFEQWKQKPKDVKKEEIKADAVEMRKQQIEQNYQNNLTVGKLAAILKLERPNTDEEKNFIKDYLADPSEGKTYTEVEKEEMYLQVMQKRGFIEDFNQRLKIKKAFIQDKNPEQGRQMINQWLDIQYEKRDKGEITELELFWDQSMLLRDCGLIDEAINSFDQVAEQAWQEQDRDLVDRCNGEIDKLIAMKQQINNKNTP